MFKTLVLDAPATAILAQADIPLDWFESFQLGESTKGLIRSEHNDHIYILSTTASDQSRFLVIPTHLLNSIEDLRHGFDRILHVGLAHFDRRVTIPVSFHQFNHGSCLSIYAQPLTKGQGQRIYFDRAPRGNNQNIYFYNLTPTAADIDDVSIDYSLYTSSVDGALDAILGVGNTDLADSKGGIELKVSFSAAYIGSSSLADWYDKKLTSEQRSFVDKDLTRPVRLKGAAGTGKTVSLVVKCVREYLSHAAPGEPFRLAFITHSHSLAHDVVRSMMDMLEPSIQGASGVNSQIWLGSLYELIQDIMEYERKRLHPLSLDGSEGREFQRLIIGDAIDEVLSDPEFALISRANCSEEFSKLLDPIVRARFIGLLANEFSSLLDADGVRLGNSAANRYRNQKRELWQIPAPKEEDRDAILRFHDKYCGMLDRSSMLSMDQMVADFSKYLETHEWRQLKERQGFDVIFVDELHYFNHMERMTFHNLFRRSAVHHGNCPLFTAQDVRQSTSDVALNRGGIALGVGQSDSIEFTKVFRSTGAIVSFLRDLDGAFPALGLNDEWGVLSQDVAREVGAVPILHIRDREVDAVDSAFELARTSAKALGGRNVAVLCTDERAFDEYNKWGRLDGKFTAIKGRDELGRLKYAGQRPVFSIPDYVAGLQFNAVYILNAERYQEDVIDRTLGEKRRFISRLYLGASRASDELHFVCATAKGGPAGALAGPIEAGRLIEKRPA